MQDELIITTPQRLREIIREAVNTCLVDKLSDGSIQAPQPPSKPATPSETCSHFGISRPTLTRWTRSGKIPVLRIGGVIRFDLDAVAKALDNQKKGR